jgi:cytochrome c oxidase subunit III
MTRLSPGAHSRAVCEGGASAPHRESPPACNRASLVRWSLDSTGFTKRSFCATRCLNSPGDYDMSSVLVSDSIAEAPESDVSPSDNMGNGIGGVPDDPDDHENSHPDRIAPQSEYRLITILAIVWIVALFTTLTLVLESRWAGSRDWFSIALPRVAYASTAVLLLSSLSVEFARCSLRRGGGRRSARWIFVALLLGLAFLSGQMLAWRELGSRGMHFASNPGSFFIYLLTGTHALHLLAGIGALASVGFFLGRPAPKVRHQTALDVVALYWHFIDALWLYLLALLFVTIQR